MPGSVPFDDQDTARHRALSDATRLTLLGALEQSVGSLDAHVLAVRVGLHVNTVRWHLRILRDAGLVVEEKRGVKRTGQAAA